MDTDLLEKISTFVARCNVSAFLRDFDKMGLRRILPTQAIRALSQAGLTLSAQEGAQVMEAYSGEDGMFSYDAFLSDGASAPRARTGSGRSVGVSARLSLSYTGADASVSDSFPRPSLTAHPPTNTPPLQSTPSGPSASSSQTPMCRRL
jgi:hypothetical protein